ncbi:MAG: hypothetical protein ACRYG7_09805 [Janthinobacterium lividum]
MSPRGHSLYFFLTPAEQVALLEVFETRYKVAYYRAGTSPMPNAPAISSLLDEESLGYLTIGDWNHSPSYLLTFPEERVVVREITLRKGGYAYAVDQGENPALARLRPSGQFTEGILVAGSVETFSRSSYSGLLFQALVKLLKQRTRRIGMSWVGPEAEEKMRLGWRLVTIASSPREYD